MEHDHNRHMTASNSTAELDIIRRLSVMQSTDWLDQQMVKNT